MTRKTLVSLLIYASLAGKYGTLCKEHIEWSPFESENIRSSARKAAHYAILSLWL